MIFTAEEGIAAPVAAVWRHLSEPHLMVEWMGGLANLRTRDGGSLAAGSRLLFDARGAERSSDVVDFVPQQRIALRSKQGSFVATYRYCLAPNGAGSVVRLEADCRAKGASRLLLPFLRPLIRRADAGQLVALKANVERAMQHTSTQT